MKKLKKDYKINNYRFLKSNDALFNEVIVHLQEIFIISSIAFSRHKNKITTRENKTEGCKKKYAKGKEI